MSKRRYDENIVTGLLAGGFGICCMTCFKYGMELCS